MIKIPLSFNLSYYRLDASQYSIIISVIYAVIHVSQCQYLCPISWYAKPSLSYSWLLQRLNNPNLAILSNVLKELSKIDKYVIKKVKERRLHLGLSQADLSHELDVSIGFIGQVESANYPAHYNLRHLNELARILKCSLYDLLPKNPL